jgi:cell division protease FtsH
VGVGAARVRDLFKEGKKHAPCIIFIDEIDAVGRHRGAGLGGGHDEREQTLNQLLVEMDGFESSEGVILVAATNRPDVLDPALMRPGRFDRRIIVSIPDIRGREGILKVHTKKTPLEDDVELKLIARGTPGFSGADLANLVNEAALLAARFDRNKITHSDFEHAKDKVMMGAERKSMIISQEEKKLTAYHEAGHALVAMLIPGTDPIHKVTIIPRGMALGLTQQLPIDEKHTYPKHYLEDRIAILLGGRIAEDKIFNEVTTGAGNDLERATDMARKMVCEWGMSDKLGPLTFGKKEEQIFLGKEIGQQRNFSESTAVEIDNEIRRIVDENCEKATKLLADNIETLKRIAENLLERETLDTEDLTAILNGEDLRAQAENGTDASSEDKKDDLEENKKEESKENKKKDDVVTETES